LILFHDGFNNSTVRGTLFERRWLNKLHTEFQKELSDWLLPLLLFLEHSTQQNANSACSFAYHFHALEPVESGFSLSAFGDSLILIPLGRSVDVLGFLYASSMAGSLHSNC